MNVYALVTSTIRRADPKDFVSVRRNLSDYEQLRAAIMVMIL